MPGRRRGAGPRHGDAGEAARGPPGTSDPAARRDVLQAYVELWSEPDPARRRGLLARCWAPRSEIIGPGYRFVGTAAVLREVARFQAVRPGWRAAATSGFDAHGAWARFSIALLAPDGRPHAEGWDVVRFGAGGRIAQVITFWGPLPAAAPASAPAGDALAGLANLGPASARWLRAAGIATPEDLARLGAVPAFARVRQVAPRASLNLLWALEGALTGLPWRTVAREHRTSLLLALESHEATSAGDAGDPRRRRNK